MAEVKLFCAVYGEGSVFSVKIARDAKVSELQKAIADFASTEEHAVPPRLVTLFLARKNGTWLKDDDSLDDLLSGEKIETMYRKMRPSWKLNDTEYFGDFQLGAKEIYILVKLPEPTPGVEPIRKRVFWLVTGSVENAVQTRGVRSRIYRIADAQFGYYDPTNVIANAKVQAFWYANNRLQIHVLFKKETQALYFMSHLRAEWIPISITLFLSQVSCPIYEQLILKDDYVAEDSDLPQKTVYSCDSEFSFVDTNNPVFKYQRIEADENFGPHGKAESAHLMSKAHCRQFPSYKKYDDDDNNRLALSRDMHGAYDMLNFEFLVVNMEVVSVSHEPVLDNRFKVDLNVSVYSHDYIFLLKHSTRTSDALVMKTFVHIEDPAVFCKCMAWKHKDVEKLRQNFFGMKPAVNQ